MITYTIADASGDASAYSYLSVSDLKTYLSVDGSGYDSLLTDIRDAVSKDIEINTGQSLKDNTITVEFDGKDRYMSLPFLPVTSLTSVEYIDRDDSSATISEASGDFEIFGLEGSRHGDYVLQISPNKYFKVKVVYRSNGESPPAEFKLAAMAHSKVVFNDDRDFDGELSKVKYPEKTIHLIRKYKRIFI